MKLKRFVSAVLSVALLTSNFNVSFAETSAELEDLSIAVDEVVSDSAVDVVESTLVALENTSVEFAGGDGTEENPYQIATAEQLDAIRYDLGACYELINDIDLSIYDNWVPIGGVYASYTVSYTDKTITYNDGDVFHGKLNGNNHKITNLTIHDSNGLDRVALFSGAFLARIENLFLTDIDINIVSQDNIGLERIGGLVCSASCSDLDNISISGNINVETPNNEVYQSIGGLISSVGGYTSKSPKFEYPSNINNCNNYVNITITDSDVYNVGGISGGISTPIYFDLCNNYGNIYVKCLNKTSSCGGICDNMSWKSEINRCNNYGDLFCDNGAQVGGIVSSKSNTDAIINNSINYGFIHAKSTQGEFATAGGICGWANGGTIENCINVGDIIAESSQDSNDLNKTPIVKASGISVTNSSAWDESYITNCYNLGNINSKIAKFDGTIISSDVGRICTITEGNMNNNYAINYSLVNNSIVTDEADVDKKNGATLDYNNILSKIKEIFPDFKYEKVSVGTDGYRLSAASSKEYEVGEITDISNCLSASLTPHLEDKSGIIWESSNPDVVEIVDTSYIDGTNSDSLLCNINCKAVGTSIITVTTADGASASCLVTVAEPKLEIVSVNYDSNIMSDIPSKTITIEFNKEVNLNGGKMELYCGNEKVCDIYSDTSDEYNGSFYYQDESLGKNKLLVTLKSGDTISKNYDGVEDLAYWYSTLLTYKPLKITLDKTVIEPKDKGISFDKINVDIDLDDYNLDYPDDIFSYRNSSSVFDSEHYDLSKILSDRITARNENIIYKLRNEDKWGGSCFGMSTLVGLTKNGLFNLSNINENTSTVNNLPMPRDSKQIGGVRDWINYIHLLQYDVRMSSVENVDSYKTDSLGEAWTAYWKEHGTGSTSTEYSNVLRAIINNAQNNNTNYTFDFAWIDDGEIVGHTILPFYYYFDSTNETHKIVCYDPSSYNMYTTITIDKELTNCSIEGWTNDPIRIGYTNLTDFSNAFDFTPIESIDSSEHKKSVEEKTELILKGNKNFELSSENGKVVYSNGNFTGNIDIIEDFNIISNGIEESSSLVFTLKDSVSYEISSSDNELDCMLISPNMFAYSKTEGNNLSVKFNINNSETISRGNISQYSSALSFDSDNMIVVRGNNEESVILNKYDSLTIDTSNDGDIDIDFVKDGELEKTEKVLGADAVEIIDTGNELKIKDYEDVSSTSTETTTEKTTSEPTTVSETTTNKLTEDITETTSLTTENSSETTTVYHRSSGSGGGSSRKATTTTTTEATTEAVSEESTEVTTEAIIAKDVRVTIGSKSIKIGDKTYDVDAAPHIQTSSNSTLVPLRFVALAICGGDVENADSSNIISWNGDTKTATISANNKTISFTAGSNTMTVNGVERLMENGVRAEIKDSRMYIPFRALGKALDVNVDWDADTKTAVYTVK